MARQRGFTLIELMIVVLVIAVLAGLALSGYQQQVRKSRRAEAKQVLADLGLKQEKYRSNNSTYGTIAQIGGAATTTYYSICPVAATCTTSATGYVLVAVPTGDQLKDSCGTLKWEMVAGVVTKSSSAGTDCW
jgi:type IV pilus assembly protein PilE